MSVNIRKAEPKDLESILLLNKKLFTFEKELADHDYNQDWTYSEKGKSYFAERIQNEKSLVYVAIDNGKTVGYILAHIANYPYRSVNPICEIENMFVEEGSRSGGIGKDLINAVKQEGKKLGVKRLKVGAIAQNERAIKFYKSHGFGDFNLYLETKL